MKTSRWSRRTLGLGLLVCGLGSTACQDGTSNESRTGRVPATLPAPPVADAGGHQRMLALLQQIRERSRTDSPYFGTDLLDEARRELEALGPDAPPMKRIMAYGKLASRELRFGHNEAAIDGFKSAQQLVQRLPAGERSRVEISLASELGIAWLRWGETQNCVARHTSESCILPIEGGGVHTLQDGSRNSMRSFARVLELSSPGSVEFETARWLYNIAAMTVGEWPAGVPEAYRIPPSVFASTEDFPRFVDVAPALGLNTFSLSGGGIAEDFDGDGLLDIATSTWDTEGQMRYFKNVGDGSFVDRTEEAGLVGLLGGLNMTHADYDNDGDADILVLRGAWLHGSLGQHPNSLLRNDGHAVFTDVTFESGLGEVHYPTQTADWGDYDNDGDLDLYIGNEATAVDRFASQLFRNEGNGTFRDVALLARVENLEFAKAVAWGDYDNDNDLDLYISNLSAQNRLYRNEGDGTFRDVAPALGVTEPLASFPAWFWDFDNDGNLDIYVATYNENNGLARLFPVVASYLGLPLRAERPKLYRGDGRGTFREVAADQHVDRVNVAMGSNFGDLDGDGFLDFYLGTGFPSYHGIVPNIMYHNLRGRGFADVSTAGGFSHLQKGHAVVFADLDNDGDQDVFENMGGAYPGDAFGDVLYENPGFGNHWLKIRLVGTRSNRSGIGARIRVEIEEDGARRTVHCHVDTGGSFGSNPLTQHIGVGAATRVRKLVVVWPTSGITQTFADVPVDRRLRIVEGEDDYELGEERPFAFRR